MPWELESRPCLNGVAVPLLKEALAYENLLGVLGAPPEPAADDEGLQKLQLFSLLSLRTNADMRFLREDL